MQRSQYLSYQFQPSAIVVLELPEPIDITLDIEKQAEIILAKALVTSLNPAAKTFFGVDSLADFTDLTFESLARNAGLETITEIKAYLQERMELFVGGGYMLEDLNNEWAYGGRVLPLKTTIFGVVEHGFLKTVVASFNNEDFSKIQEQLVAGIARDLAACTGAAFVTNLVKCLTDALGVDSGALIRVEPGTDCAKDGVYYSRSTGLMKIAGADLPLEGSPGAEVLKGEVKIFKRGVRSQYPQDKLLEQLGAESYVAVPIWGQGETTLGLLVLLDSKEIQNTDLISAVLTIFAMGASAELERLRIDELGQREEARQQALIENNSSGMFSVDINPPMPITLSLPKQVQWLADHSFFADCNKAFATLVSTGKKEDVVGLPLLNKYFQYDFATQARAFVGNDYVFSDHVISLTGYNNKTFWISISISGELVDDELTRIFGVVTNVSERMAHAKEMEYRATHDGLTGLPNRSFFVEQMERVLEFSNRDSKHAILILDLDGFKEVNDTLGHETGDELLKRIGPRLEKVLSNANAMLARLGGDEFAVLIEDYGDEDGLKKLAHAFVEEIRSPYDIGGLELVVGGSVGIALYPGHGDNVSSLMRCADIAMYQAKENSTDFTLYSSKSDHYTMRRLTLMMDIRQAVEHAELRLFYQPIVNVADQHIVGFEALIRWQHPELGLLPPGEFIPLIELTDTIIPVTWWVIETAIKQLAEWKVKGWAYRISVNVATRNLADQGFVSFIESCLSRYDVEGSLLEVEITESTLMADPQKARAVLQEIADLGIYISIDDYGTGYSSLAYLKSLPIDTLKIDRTFISQMLVDNQDEIIVSSTIQLAHNLGLKVTAEGIEDISLVSRLHEMGCDKGQGFFFCKPIPVNELQSWLTLHERQAPIAQMI